MVSWTQHEWEDDPLNFVFMLLGDCHTTALAVPSTSTQINNVLLIARVLRYNSIMHRERYTWSTSDVDFSHEHVDDDT